MVAFKDFNTLKAAIAKDIAQGLERSAAIKVKQILEDFIREEVYQKYEPTMYERTMDIMNSVRVSPVIMGNVISIKIYISTDDHSGWRAGKDDVSIDQVFEWLEEGSVWKRPKSDAWKNTLEKLEGNQIVLHSMISYLTARGYKIIK